MLARQENLTFFLQLYSGNDWTDYLLACHVDPSLECEINAAIITFTFLGFEF
jgi:hypothetical protein